MAGNQNSGRKADKVKSVQYRFQMPHNLDKALVKEAKRLNVEPRSLLKKILAEKLGVEFY